MNALVKFVHVYLVPLAILTALFFGLRWIPVQMTLELLVPLAASYIPASVPPMQIILALGFTVGGVFAMLILTMTRYLHRRVIYRQRIRALEDKRKRGHDDIAASVFDPSAIALDEFDDVPAANRVNCALEEDSRLAMLIGTLWAKPEFYNFLNRLLKADAGEGRLLTPEMRHELAFLRNLYIDQSEVLSSAASAPPAEVAAQLPGRGDHTRGIVTAALMLLLLLVPVP